jgi:fucose permease
VLTIAIVALRGRAATIVTVVLCGVACGPVFPTMMAIVLLSVPPSTMGRAVGIFFFFASVGWTVIPTLIGAVARRTNDIQRGFVVAAASSALFLLLTIARGMLAVAAH